jgi:deoxyhypusine synthase
MIYVHQYKHKDFKIDIVQDLRKLYDIAMDSKKSGMIALGAGLVKHHICNANLMRNGADYAVYINNEQEFDGSHSGAYPEEAISWGKIKSIGNDVKFSGDATILFPLIVAKCFKK